MSNKNAHTLTVWCLRSSTAVTQCDAQNAESQVKETAFYRLPCGDLIKIPVFCSFYLAI